MHSSFIPMVIAWWNVFHPEPGIMSCMCWDVGFSTCCRTMKWNRWLLKTWRATHLCKQAPSPISLTMDQDRKQMRPLLLLDRAELEWWLRRFSSSESWPCCVLTLYRKVNVTLCSLHDCMFGGRLRAKEKTLTCTKSWDAHVVLGSA